jgi:methylmalonyl-CoA mutase N-terminal domain/subunit
VIVGVNKFADGEDPPIIPAPNYSELERGQKERLAAVRSARDGAKLAVAMAALKAAAPAYATPGAARAPLMPLIIDAVKARATVGEISDLLREVWGEYRPA